jgi:hypothetical protein
MAKGYRVPKIVYETIYNTAVREIEEKGRIVISKRDPNTHRNRIQGNYVYITHNNAIEVHPVTTSSYGADFDGDSCNCFIPIYIQRSSKGIIEVVRVHISQLNCHFNVKLESKKVKSDGRIIKNYKVLDEIFIPAINESNGETELKRITHWSIHENLKMYYLSRKKKNGLINDVKDLWVSDNHSMVVYDEETQEIIKAKPEEVMKNPQRYCMIRKKIKNNVGKTHIKNFMDCFRNYTNHEESGYLMGAWLGDGYITYTGSNNVTELFALTNSDERINKVWSDILRENFMDNKIVESKDIKSMYTYNRFRKKDGSETKNALRSYMIDEKFCDQIIKHFGKGCAEKHLPFWLANIPRDFTRGLLAGYIDTDGTVAKKYIKIQSKSEKLIKDFSYYTKTILGIETSIFKEIKKYTLGPTGEHIKTDDPNLWREFWSLDIRMKKENIEELTKIANLLNSEKREKLFQILDEIENKESTSRLTYIPCDLIKSLSAKERKNILNISRDNYITIRKNNFCQKEIIIPENLINNSNLSKSIKNLLIKQNNDEIEFIPCEMIDFIYDSEKTTGYDLTVEDFKTFCTDEGIFLYDTYGLYAPLSEEAQKQVKDKMVSAYDFNSLGGTHFELNKEMFIGLYTLTYTQLKDKTIKKPKNFEELDKLHIGQIVEYTLKGKRIKTTAGRIIFNLTLPKWFPIVNEEIDKKKINKILKEVLEKGKETEFVETIDKVMKLGFKYATLYPKTFSIDMGKLPKNILDLKVELAKEPDLSKQMNILSQMNKELAEYLKETDSDLHYIIASGASKGMEQMRQIMVSKGVVLNAVGEPLAPIIESFNDGYTPESYFEASAGSREGTISRSINTRSGGYAYRKIVFIVGNVEADINIGNCGTKSTLDIKLTKDLFPRLQGRYVLENGKVSPIRENMIGEIIHLRSPIFCETKKICRTCYGDLIKQLDSSNVGILAAQSVGSLAEKIMKCSAGGILEGESGFKSMEDLWEEVEEKENCC